MKLFNKSQLADAVLEAVLAAAGRAVGAKTTGVVVKVTAGRNRGVYGMAHHCFVVYKWHLQRGGSRTKGIKTNGGYFQLTIPRPAKSWDFLGLAQQVFEVAAHSGFTLRDYQPEGAGACRLLHVALADGVHSMTADRKSYAPLIRVDEALERGAVCRNQDAIIALAVEMEKRASTR